MVYEAALWYFGENGNREKSIDLDAKIKVLITKLQNEDVVLLEKHYVQSQESYNDEWRAAIEKTLLDCRKGPSSMSERDPKDKLQKLLLFSHKTILLPPDYDPDTEDYVDAVDKFIAASFAPPQTAQVKALSFYDGDTREGLQGILRNYCEASQVASNGESGETAVSFILYGPPGGGKSVAAKLVATAAKLPFYVLDFSDASDFKAEKLYGGSAFLNASEGHLPQAFLACNEAGERAKNIVVIVDDIHRAFTKEKVGGETSLEKTSLLKVLQTITDAEVKTFNAGFFGIPNFDKSQVHFIFTTNTDFADPENDGEFNALLSRCTFIRFQPASPDQKKQRVKDYITDQKLGRQKLHYGKPDSWDGLRSKIADFIVDKFDVDDCRIAHKRVEVLLRKPEAEWSQVAVKEKWRATDVVAE